MKYIQYFPINIQKALFVLFCFIRFSSSPFSFPQFSTMATTTAKTARTIFRLVSTNNNKNSLTRRRIRPTSSLLSIPSSFFSSSSSSCSTSTHQRSSSSSTTFDWAPPLRAPLFYDQLCSVEDEKHHWIVMMDTHGFEFDSEQALFKFYIHTLARVIGIEEAKRKIYFVSCKWVFGFGAEIDEETKETLEDQPKVLCAFEDPDYDARSNDPRFRSVAQFASINLNRRLDDIFSYHHLSAYNSAWNSDHWLVHIKPPGGGYGTEQQIVNLCIRILAGVVGSEEDAKKRLYIVWCKMPYGFAVEVDEQTSNKLKALPDVLTVLPDFAFDVKDKVSLNLVLVISPLSPFQFDSANYFYYPLSQVHSSEELEERIEESIDSIHPPRRFRNKHWSISMEKVGCEVASPQQMIDSCIETLATSVGSDEEIKYKLKGEQSFQILNEDGYCGAQINEPSVRSTPCFTLANQNCRLDNIFSYHHMSPRNSKWSFDHWLIIVKQPDDGRAIETQTLDFCCKILSQVVGSEQEARKKIYIIWHKIPFGFGAEIDKDTVNKLKDLPEVIKVLPDYAFDVKDEAAGALCISSSSRGSDYYYYNANWVENMCGQRFRRWHNV